MTEPDRPAIGEAAPVIAAQRKDGTPWSAAEHHGRHLVLIFHRHIH